MSRYSLILVATWMLLLTLMVAAENASSTGNPPIEPREKVASFQLDLGPIGRLVLVEGPREGVVGHFDELVLFPASEAPSGTTILKTEGRKLVGTAVGAFTATGAKDLVLTLDTGGAGGYVDLVLLSLVGNTVQPIWEEEGVKGGRASFEVHDGILGPKLIIDRLEENLASGTVTLKTEWYVFRKGKVMRIQ